MALPPPCLYFRRADEPLRILGGSLQDAQDLLVNLMTIMYICVQETLNDPEGLKDVHENLSEYIYEFLHDKLAD